MVVVAVMEDSVLKVVVVVRVNNIPHITSSKNSSIYSVGLLDAVVVPLVVNYYGSR